MTVATMIVVCIGTYALLSIAYYTGRIVDHLDRASNDNR